MAPAPRGVCSWDAAAPRGEEVDALWALHWCCISRGYLLPCFPSAGFQTSCTAGGRVSQRSKSVIRSVGRAVTPRQKCVAGARKLYQDSAELLP